MDHFLKLERAIAEGAIPSDLGSVIRNFYLSYGQAAKENGYTTDALTPILNQFLDLVAEQLADPYTFEIYHRRITNPINYYQFGLDLIRPLIVFPKSVLKGIGNLDAIQTATSKGENVILFGNHQTEPDPQAISLLIEKSHPEIAENMIFVAGHRVTTDPLAAPFSKGRNLLCIYSKRHIEHPPEEKAAKLSHNQRTLKKMAQLLEEGGKCIYVAPSGGRDRQNAEGKIEVAPFDPQSIEMFYLVSQQATKPTHFYPLTLSTYHLLPPPGSIAKELGEERRAHATPVFVAFGSKIDMENYPGKDLSDKKQKRQSRADFIWKAVTDEYDAFLGK